MPEASVPLGRGRMKQLVGHSELRGASLTITEKVDVCSAWVWFHLLLSSPLLQEILGSIIWERSLCPSPCPCPTLHHP